MIRAEVARTSKSRAERAPHERPALPRSEIVGAIRLRWATRRVHAHSRANGLPTEPQIAERSALKAMKTTRESRVRPLGALAAVVHRQGARQTRSKAPCGSTTRARFADVKRSPQHRGCRPPRALRLPWRGCACRADGFERAGGRGRTSTLDSLRECVARSAGRALADAGLQRRSSGYAATCDHGRATKSCPNPFA